MKDRRYGSGFCIGLVKLIEIFVHSFEVFGTTATHGTCMCVTHYKQVEVAHLFLQ